MVGGCGLCEALEGGPHAASGVVSLGASAAWCGVLMWVIIGVGEAVPRGFALVCSVVYSPS